MNLKALFTTILVVCSITLLNAQSKDILAKSAMLNADEAYANGQYSECIDYLTDVVTNLGRTNSRIQYLKVKSLIELGSNDKYDKSYWLQADTALKVFFEVTPENSYVPEKYDEMLMAVGKVKKSISYAEAYDGKDVSKLKKLDAAIVKDPSSSYAYNERAWAKFMLDDKQGAFGDWSKSIELDPNNKKAYKDRADAKHFSKDYQGAIQDWSKSIELNPIDSWAYRRRAESKAYLKDYQGAINDYTKSIELSPDGSAVYFLRGKIYQDKLKDIQAAKKDFEKVILIGGNFTCVAEAYYYLGEKDKAFNLLNKMLKDPDANREGPKSIYYAFALLYSMDGNQAEAINALKNAFEKGCDYFDNIEEEEDFDNIRNSPEFKELINKYKNK